MTQETGIDPWLEGVRDALIRTAGLTPGDLELDERAIDTLLEVARIAARRSGQRLNAPLLCYLIGRAEAGADLETLAEIVRATQPA